jgi:hypothetical protein
MMRHRTPILTAAFGALATLGIATAPVRAQLPPIGAIDLYGVRKISPDRVREALGIAVGDSVSGLALLTAPTRLAEIPGVSAAALDPVCCLDGRTTLYVGIAEDGTPPLAFREAPDGASRLAPDVVAAGEAFGEALMSAVQRGVAGEDASQGHSLMVDSAARAIQTRFVEFAARDLDTLRAVLRTSADADHRALAAQVIAYAADKKLVVPDLVEAMRDPSSAVRNNATRALAVIAVYAQRHPELGIRVPYEPFIDLLNSVVWTDRNKASFALVQLTQSRDSALLAALAERAFDSLVDIARWTPPGHAAPGVIILGRIAGISDEEILAKLQRGEREAIIAAARAAARDRR